MMKATLTTALTLTAALMLSACGNSQMPTANRMPVMMQAQSNQQISNEVIVRFQADASRMALQQFNQKYGLQTVRFVPELNAYIMVFRQAFVSQNAFSTAVKRMSQEPAVAMIEANQRIEISPIRPEMSISPIYNR